MTNDDDALREGMAELLRSKIPLNERATPFIPVAAAALEYLRERGVLIPGLPWWVGEARFKMKGEHIDCALLQWTSPTETIEHHGTGPTLAAAVADALGEDSICE